MDDRKAAERLRARERRRAIPRELRREKALRVADAVLALPEVRDARVVGGYVAVHSEVATSALLQRLLVRGAVVAVPVLQPERMRLARLAALDGLVEGERGIPVPPEPRSWVDDPDVVLVPGLLFTAEGHRLGNGGGHFDRLLAATPRALRVGLAYEEQVVPQLPLEAHDERLDVLVTDARVLRTPR